MTSKVLFLTALAFSMLNMGILFSQDVISLSNSESKLLTEQNFLAGGDSCSVLNPERHDGLIHQDGFSIAADSLRFVILFHPQIYPWTYNKVCIGLTKITGGATTLSYNVVVYDSSASGGPGNLLYFSPVQTAANISGFPQLSWYSTVPGAVTINSGAVYIGIQFHNQPVLGVYLSVDRSADTPLWPGYYATNGTFPPVWQQVLNYPAFAAYKCFAIRTEGQQAIGIQNLGSTVPLDFFLNQNYPNPFNPATEFTFGIPHSGNVRITVYDMLGRLVETIADEFKSAGTYSAKFDASALSSGVYVYKLESSDFTGTKKMLLIK